MKKATRIISEVEYTNENGDSVHSDLDFDFDLKEQMRPVLHECLDEWLDKSNGEGGFYLRNANHHFEDYDEGQPKRTPLPDGTLERLNKDGGVSKIRGDKFYSIVEEFQKLSDEDKAKYQLN